VEVSIGDLVGNTLFIGELVGLVAVQAARIPDTANNAIIHSLILFTSLKLFYLS
jgi:hypothetical protein